MRRRVRVCSEWHCEGADRKARQIIELLEARGWYESRQSGSHKIFKNWNDPFKHTVVPFHKGKTLPPGTQRAIMRDAGITPDEL